jgi:hypothetical protein
VMRPLDCFAALAMTAGSWLVYFWASPNLRAPTVDRFYFRIT